jgi:hypothetical protein
VQKDSSCILDRFVTFIRIMSAANSQENEKWYPGKYAGVKRSSVSSPSPQSPSSSMERNKEPSNPEDKEKWYPGKYMRRLSSTSPALNRASTSESEKDGVKSGSPVMVEKEEYADLHVDEKRKIGKVSIDLQSFKYFCKDSFTVSISLDGNTLMFPINDVHEERPPHDMSSLTLYDISSNISIQFLDQTNRQPFGRIIMPVSKFLDVMKPKPASAQWHQLYPPYKQNDSPDFYRTGLEGVHSYAMSRPVNAIGFVKVYVSVDLTLPPIKCLWLDKFIPPSSSVSTEYTAKVNCGLAVKLECH